MLELGSTVLLFLLKLIFKSKAKRDLSDADFLAHIRAHQLRRSGLGDTALSFEDALTKARIEMEGVEGASNDKES